MQNGSNDTRGISETMKANNQVKKEYRSSASVCSKVAAAFASILLYRLQLFYGKSRSLAHFVDVCCRLQFTASQVHSGGSQLGFLPNGNE